MLARYLYLHCDPSHCAINKIFIIESKVKYLCSYNKSYHLPSNQWNFKTKKSKIQKIFKFLQWLHECKYFLRKTYYWRFYALFRQDYPTYIFINSLHFTKKQIKKEIFNCAVKQDTDRMQISCSTDCFQTNLQQIYAVLKQKRLRASSSLNFDKNNHRMRL